MNTLTVITANRCAPSGALKVLLNKLQKEEEVFKDIKINYLDIKEDLSKILIKVKGTPSIILNDEHIKIGYPTKEQLIEWLNYHTGNKR